MSNLPDDFEDGLTDHFDRFLNEAADLLFHYLVLLQAKGHSLRDVVGVLEARHRTP